MGGGGSYREAGTRGAQAQWQRRHRFRAGGVLLLPPLLLGRVLRPLALRSRRSLGKRERILVLKPLHLLLPRLLRRGECLCRGPPG